MCAYFLRFSSFLETVTSHSNISFNTNLSLRIHITFSILTAQLTQKIYNFCMCVYVYPFAGEPLVIFFLSLSLNYSKFAMISSHLELSMAFKISVYRSYFTFNLKFAHFVAIAAGTANCCCGCCYWWWWWCCCFCFNCKCVVDHNTNVMRSTFTEYLIIVKLFSIQTTSIRSHP